MEPVEKEIRVEVAKTDTEHGLVFGYAIVCTEDGEPYIDKQDDYIPEDSMLEASVDFMLHSRDAGEGHDRTEDGQVVVKGTILFAFPMTADIAKALDIKVRKTGLIIAAKPDADTLAKFESGELTGFSIGGYRVKDEPMEAA